MTRVSVLGAHTAVAKALVDVLDEREIDVELRLATTTELLEGELTLVDEATLKWADLVVLAFRGETARRFADAARALGKPVLDLVEELVNDKRARWIFPGIDPDAGRAFDPAVFSLLPIGLGGPAVSVLRAFAALEPTRATIATYESTSTHDQPGMDELSDQMRARFSMREVEANVLSGTIAFGCLPLVGRSGESPFELDEVLRRAIESGVEDVLPELDLSVTRILVPTFSADSAVMVIDLQSSPDEKQVIAALKNARGIHFLGAQLPSSFEAIGRDDSLAGRLLVEPQRITLWLATDRLRRGSATLAALAIERFISRV